MPQQSKIQNPKSKINLGLHGQNAILVEDHVIDIGNGDFGAAILAINDDIAHFDLGRNALAFDELATADGDDFALSGFLFRGVGNVNAARGFLFRDGRLHDYLVT
jgi:hypothetical protein